MAIRTGIRTQKGNGESPNRKSVNNRQASNQKQRPVSTTRPTDTSTREGSRARIDDNHIDSRYNTRIEGNELVMAIRDVPEQPNPRNTRDEQEDILSQTANEERVKIINIMTAYMYIVNRDIDLYFGTALFQDIDWDAIINPMMGGSNYIPSEYNWITEWANNYRSCRGYSHPSSGASRYCPAYCDRPRQGDDAYQNYYTYPQMALNWEDYNYEEDLFEQDVREQFLLFLECYMPLESADCKDCGDPCELKYDHSGNIIGTEYKFCFKTLWDKIKNQEWLSNPSLIQQEFGYTMNNDFPDENTSEIWPCITVTPRFQPEYVDPPQTVGGWLDWPSMDWNFGVTFDVDVWEQFNCEINYWYDTQGGADGYGYGQEMCCGLEKDYEGDTFYGVCQNMCSMDDRCTWEADENSIQSSDGYYIHGTCKNNDCGECEDITNMELCVMHDLCTYRGGICKKKNLDCNVFSSNGVGCNYLMEHCGLDLSDCASWCENLPNDECIAHEEPNNRLRCGTCPEDRPVQCPDGQCVIHEFNCLGCPDGFIICPDMTCAPSEEFCGGHSTSICCDSFCATNYPFLMPFRSAIDQMYGADQYHSHVGSSGGSDGIQQFIEGCTAGYGPCNFHCCGYWYPDIVQYEEDEGDKGAPPVHPLLSVNDCCEYASGCMTPGYSNTWSTQPYDQRMRGEKIGATTHNQARVIDTPQWNSHERLWEHPNSDIEECQAEEGYNAHDCGCNEMFRGSSGMSYEKWLNWHAGPYNDCVCIRNRHNKCNDESEPFGYEPCEDNINSISMNNQFGQNWPDYSDSSNEHHYAVSSIAHEYVTDGVTGEGVHWNELWGNWQPQIHTQSPGSRSSNYIGPPHDTDCAGECTCNKICGEVEHQPWANDIVHSGYGLMDVTYKELFDLFPNNPNVHHFPLEWEHFGWGGFWGKFGYGEGHYLQGFHGEFKYQGGWFNDWTHENVTTHEDTYVSPDGTGGGNYWRYHNKMEQWDGYLGYIWNIFPPPKFCQDFFDLDTTDGKYEWQLAAECKHRTNACVSQIDNPNNNQFGGLGKCVNRDEEHHPFGLHPDTIYKIRYQSADECRWHCCTSYQGGSCNNTCNEGRDENNERYWSCCNTDQQFTGTISCSGYGNCP